MSKKSELQQLQTENSDVQKEITKLRRELEQKQHDLQRERRELAEMEARTSRKFIDIIKASGKKDYFLYNRLHMSGPTFSGRKSGRSASLWRLDELKTLAVELGIDPLALIASILPDVDYIPKDKEDARELRRSYNKAD